MWRRIKCLFGYHEPFQDRWPRGCGIAVVGHEFRRSNYCRHCLVCLDGRSQI